jgi:hypothetical protein
LYAIEASFDFVFVKAEVSRRLLNKPDPDKDRSGLKAENEGLG